MAHLTETEIKDAARTTLGTNWRRRALAALDTLADAEFLLTALGVQSSTGPVCEALRRIGEAGE